MFPVICAGQRRPEVKPSPETFTTTDLIREKVYAGISSRKQKKLFIGIIKKLLQSRTHILRKKHSRCEETIQKHDVQINSLP